MYNIETYSMFQLLGVVASKHINNCQKQLQQWLFFTYTHDENEGIRERTRHFAFSDHCNRVDRSRREQSTQSCAHKDKR